MEESSEKRRERLKAMREEASLASSDGGGGAPVASPPDAPGLPLLTDLPQPPPSSPSPRFEFYTDPLAAFSGHQKKKKTKSSSGSPFGGAPASPARPAPFQSPPSPQWQPRFANPNPSLPPAGSFSTPRPPNHNANMAPNSNPNPNLTPSGSFSAPGSSNPNCNPNVHNPGSMGKYYPGSLNSPGPCIPNPNDHINPYPNSNPNFHHPSILGKFNPNSTPSGSFSDCNPNLIPQGGYSNPGPAPYGPRPAFRSHEQPSSAPYQHNGCSSGGFSLNSPEPYQYNGGRSNFSTESPPQHRASDVQSSAWSQGSNRSRGNFRQSPGSSSRGGRTPGRSGGWGSQRSNNHGAASAVTNPELFTKRCMLSDPWKDLVPVRIESVAFRLNSCSVSVASSHDWLPRSVSKGMTSPSTKQIAVSASGPSLAESLAASFADAVSGEDTA